MTCIEKYKKGKRLKEPLYKIALNNFKILCKTSVPKSPKYLLQMAINCRYLTSTSAKLFQLRFPTFPKWTECNGQIIFLIVTQKKKKTKKSYIIVLDFLCPKLQHEYKTIFIVPFMTIYFVEEIFNSALFSRFKLNTEITCIQVFYKALYMQSFNQSTSIYGAHTMF